VSWWLAVFGDVCDEYPCGFDALCVRDYDGVDRTDNLTVFSYNITSGSGYTCYTCVMDANNSSDTSCRGRQSDLPPSLSDTHAFLTVLLDFLAYSNSDAV